MQEISLHIEYLLRSNECVILPGIGAFLRTYKGASLAEDGALSAPRFQVCFNSSIVASDGLLCHSIARRNRISFEQASVLLSDAAERCRNALMTDGELSIGKLGRLTMDVEQRISFVPYSVLYSGIWADIPSADESKERLLADVESRDADEQSSDSRYYVIKISRKAVRYAAVAALCLLTATTMLLPSASRNDSFLGQPSPQYASVVPGVEKLSRKAVISPKERVACEQSTVSESASLSESAEEELIEAEKRFYLIVATFAKESDCEKFIASQSDAATLSVVTSGKVSRVYSAASDNRDELVAQLNSPEHKSLHPQAWVWKNPAY